MKHLLLAEDDFDFATILKQYLELSGFEVTWAKDGAEALLKFNGNTNIKFALCILDVMMPKMDGFAVAEQIINLHPEMPFLFLTAKSLKEDKIKGLQLGADDYILKPCEADELVLRIQNILRRNQKTNAVSEAPLTIGTFELDVPNLLLNKADKQQRITEKEAQLLHYLFTNKNKIIKREAILKALWGNDDFFSGRSMDVFISRLRKYLAEDSTIAIHSIRGIGFEFRVA
jgi:DNA-binding response OmpR family regulator